MMMAPEGTVMEVLRLLRRQVSPQKNLTCGAFYE